jgi:hypothetical protein
MSDSRGAEENAQRLSSDNSSFSTANFYETSCGLCGEQIHFRQPLTNWVRIYCSGSHNQSGCPPTDQPDYPMMNLAAFWQQMLPSMPVLPV